MSGLKICFQSLHDRHGAGPPRRRNPMAKLKTCAAKQPKQTTAIVKELRNAGVSDPRTELIERRVNQLIEILRELKPHGPPRGNRKANRDHAKKLISSIDQCEQLLADYPENFPLNFLFTRLPTSLFVADTEAVEDRAEAVYLEAERRRFDFVVFLRDMRKKCERIIEHRLGEHGRSGYQQERAAMASRELLEPFGIPLHPTSPTSAYRTIARLFLEATTGTCSADGADIQRACEAVARLPRSVTPDASLLSQLRVISRKPWPLPR